MRLELRTTHKNDLPFVFETEQNASKSGFVTRQKLEEHEEFLVNKDIRHLIIEEERRPLGYVILAGLEDVNENVEFVRIVVSEKGKGYGRKALQLVKILVFEEFKAHRLWLDVFDFNKRAIGLYESEGFTVEGIWRECAKDENGRKSLVFMSMLKDEFKEK